MIKITYGKAVYQLEKKYCDRCTQNNSICQAWLTRFNDFKHPKEWVEQTDGGFICTQFNDENNKTITVDV